MQSHMTILALVTGSAAATFDVETGKRGVYYSKIAYCPTAKIADWTCAACPKFPTMQNVSVHVTKANDEQAYVGYNAKAHEIVLAFRGTMNIAGWVTDLKFTQIEYVPRDGKPSCKDCKVLGGLHAAYRRASDAVWPRLEQLAAAHPRAAIFVTGHSEGAATAGLAYPDVVRAFPKHAGAIRLYNYGSPRLGNPAFARWADGLAEPSGEHYRCANFGDPIVHLPPLTLNDIPFHPFGEWIHAPREVFFPSAFGNPAHHKICKGSVQSDAKGNVGGVVEDPSCADSSPLTKLTMKNHTTYLSIGLGCFLE